MKGGGVYVNLGASQVRNQLDGFVLTPPPIENTSRNQAVLVHAATGQHLLELYNLFWDVIASSSEVIGGIVSNRAARENTLVPSVH